MGDRAPFAAEKDVQVTGAARDGVSTAPLRHGVPPAPAPRVVLPPDAPGARDPHLVQPYKGLRVRSRYECQEMQALAAESKTFGEHLSTLAAGGVGVEYEVGPLERSAGGGRTTPVAGKKYVIRIDPETVIQGWHVFEIFLHEHGHVAELHRVALTGAREGKYYWVFTNRVQAELGLRVTPDSHLLEAPEPRRPPSRR